MLEIVLERLSKSGIKKFHVTTHYKPEKILEYFGDGKSFGVDINYLNEASPMGTAGALSRIGRPDGDLLVINGDVLTDLDFGKMFEYHSQNGAVLTVAVRPYEHVVPFGVVRLSDFEVTSIEEKPTQVWHVSAGIYVLSPSALDFVKEDEHLDMPELITRLISAGCRVSSFLIQESWVDVGRFDDYERAVQEAAT